MAVFRIERNKNYTVMSNYHLRDKSISLKAKGLLSQMLSLPEEWDYTLSGLACINKESKDAIRTAVQELEHAGYICRRQTRNERGGFAANEYVIYERPVLEEPLSEYPTTGNASPDNPTQIKKESTRKDKSKKDSLPPPTPSTSSAPSEPRRRESTSREELSDCRSLIRENIGYDQLLHDSPEDGPLIDELVEIMAETACTKRKTIRIGGSPYVADVVRSRLLKLDGEHIRFVLDCMRENSTQIRNIRQYLLAVLFNAPTTISSYYAARVSHDLGPAGNSS